MKRLPLLFIVALLLLVACSGAKPSASTAQPQSQPAQTSAAESPPTHPPAASPLPTAIPAASVAPTSTPVPSATPLPSPTATPTPQGPLTLASDAFADEGDIPPRYAQRSFRVEVAPNAFFECENPPESQNLSPALRWANVPPEAVSLVLLAWDQMDFAIPAAPPDARFPHWSVYSIPYSVTHLAEGVAAEPTLPDGSAQGLNGYPEPYQVGYGGPCPGAEKHLYVFTLYALDSALDLAPGAEMDAVQAAMQGHILAQAELKGYYAGP